MLRMKCLLKHCLIVCLTGLMIAGSVSAKSQVPVGRLYNLCADYSLGISDGLACDKTGLVCPGAPGSSGTWTFVHDSKVSGTGWGTISWRSGVRDDSSVTVTVRSSSDRKTWSEWSEASNGSRLVDIPAGRYLNVRVRLHKSKTNRSPVLYDMVVLPNTEIQTLLEARLGTNGDLADVDDAYVTAVFDDFFYIEDDDQCSGIRVNKPNHGLLVGQMADVYGVIRTNAVGEKYIDASVGIVSGTGTVGPIEMTNQDSTGLLVTTRGAITGASSSNSPTWFTIDDGSKTGVRVILPPGVNLDPSWRAVTVTGISSLEKIGRGVQRAILARSQDDIKQR